MSESQKSEKNGKNVTIVCFSGVDWWYHNEGLFCPQVMRKLAKHYEVLFVNSLGMRVPSLRKDRNAARKILRKLRSIGRFLRKEDGLHVLSPLSLPFLGSRVGRWVNMRCVLGQVRLVMTILGFRGPIFYIECPPALEVVKKLGRKFLIYQRTDLFEAMPGINTAYITSLDDELTRSADLVLYVNRALWKQGIQKNKNSLLIGHGVDFGLFADVENSNYVPGDITEIPKPIIGYFGDLSEKTIDMTLLEFAIERLPEMSFVFIGSVSTDVSMLKRFANVHFLGQKPYDEVPFYGKEFDVAIMPWNKSRWIEFCNPIKIKEYLALGKPIVTTYYPEIQPYSDLVYIADDYDAFISCIHKAVEERDPVMVQKRRDRVRNETWDSKVTQIKAFIEKGLN